MRSTLWLLIFTVATITMFVLPVLLQAQFSGGAGTEANPFLVGTVNDLDNLRNYYTGYYFKQISNINLDIPPWNQSFGWQPIGLIEGSRTYYYDGDGYSIQNLQINSPSNQTHIPKALFTNLIGGYIRNLTLENILIFGTSKTGGLAYSCAGTEIDNCHVTGAMLPVGNTNDHGIGGLIGTATAQSSIQNCSANIKIGDYYIVGGIVGLASDSNINNCWAWVRINNCGMVGGLAGKVHNCVVTGCSSGGTITAAWDGGSLGGLIGRISASNVTSCFSRVEMAIGNGLAGGLAYISTSGSVISNCYSEVWFEGGLDAYSFGLIAFAYGTHFINCYSRSVQNNTECFAALAYLEEGSTISGCCYNSELMTPDVNNSWEIGRTTEQMTYPYGNTINDTYAGWDFQSIWMEDVNGISNLGYPMLRDMDYSHIAAYPKFSIGSGFYGHTVEQIISCITPGAEIRFTLDGSTPDETSTLYVEPFLIGSETLIKARAFRDDLFPSRVNEAHIYAYTPNFPGSGTIQDPFIIYNPSDLYELRFHLDSHFRLHDDIYLNYVSYEPGNTWLPIGKYYAPDSPDNRPFTGSLDGYGYEIYNFAINQPDATATGLFAYCENAQFKDLTIRPGYVNGGGYTGALAGIMKDCDVLGCQAWSNVSTSAGSAGLMAGKSVNTIFSQSFTTGAVSGGDTCGGMVGILNGGGTVDCYAITSVSDCTIGGGLLGSFSGQAEVQRCYSAGFVSGQGAGFGGLVGSGDPALVSSSYWDIDSSGQDSSAGGVSLRTSQMMIAENYLGWDFQNVWIPPILHMNSGYPMLWNNMVNPVDNEDELAPAVSILNVYPNPFSTKLNLQFELPQATQTELCVYNSRGQKVRKLLSENLSSGAHNLCWDGKDKHGRIVASGIYLIQIEAGKFKQFRKVMLIK
ncbi:MAG: FN3 associated domain-containing protein [Candidatus Cloacimonetes bacterium]|nr:FN3 associated domain-containing protein [Candidatus Cloacimonadota bacterium]